MKIEHLPASLPGSLYTPAALKAMHFPAQDFRIATDAELSDLQIDLEACLRDPDNRVGAFCCDVLRIERDVLITQPTLIIARRIEFAAGAAVVISNAGEHRGELSLWAQETVALPGAAAAPLALALIGADMAEQRAEWRANRRSAGGLRADAAGLTMLDARAIEPGLMYVGSPLYFHLQAASALAVMLADDYPALAVAQLSWVYDIARHHALTDMLAAQALGMIIDLQAGQAHASGMLTIPLLDYQVYADTAAGLKDLLLLRHQAWQRLQDQAADDQHRQDALQLAFEDRQQQLDLAAQLAQQADQARRALVLASGEAGSQLKQAQLQLDACAASFTIGVLHWKENQILDGVFSLVVESGKLLAAVACVVGGLPPLTGGAKAGAAPPSHPGGGKDVLIGDSAEPWFLMDRGPGNSGERIWLDEDSDGPWYAIDLAPDTGAGGVPAAPGGAADKSGTGEALAQLGEKAGDALGALSGMAAAALAIYKVIQMARTLELLSGRIQAGADERIGLELSTTRLAGLALVTGGEHDWQRLENSTQFLFDSMGDAVLAQIEGGRDYRLAFRQMLVAARSLCQARLAVARANAQCIELALRSQSAQAMAAALEQRRKAGAAALELRQAFMPAAFARVIDARRSVHIALDAHRRALAYFTLQPLCALPPPPRMSDDIDSLCARIAATYSRELSLKALQPVPQVMNDVEIVFDDPHTLAALQSGQCVQLSLEPGHPAFAGFYRVRMARLRVFLDGVDQHGDIRVVMRSCGVYYDRTAGGEVAGFVGSPVNMKFQYEASSRLVRFDGAVARRYSDDFFMPTPFTGWELRFSHQGGAPLDLGQVTALRLLISGEATGGRDD